LNLGLLDELSLSQVNRFKEECFSEVERKIPEVINNLRKNKILTEEIKKRIVEELKKYIEENFS
jgi:F0F1-type ATP synthase alpha subunit